MDCHTINFLETNIFCPANFLVKRFTYFACPDSYLRKDLHAIAPVFFTDGENPV